MESIGSEETEICLLRKKQKIRENKDFMSDLPDSVLMHILSFLPLHDAIKTVLIPHFGKMWLNMPVLDLDNCEHHRCVGDYTCDNDSIDKFMGMIHQICQHRSDTTLDKVRLNLTFARTFSSNESGSVLDPNYQNWVKEKNAAIQIEELISYALNREVKVLDLNFADCDVLMVGEQHHELPDVFSSNHLIDLSLDSCYIRSCEKLNLPALKVLSLDGVLLRDRVMAKLLLGCPTLEELSVSGCHGFRNLTCENPNLKKLKIYLDGERTRLYISCPHVVSLDISGWIERAKLLDVSPSLVDATITYSDIYFRCTEKTYADVLELLLKVQHCKNFSAWRGSIMVLSIWELKKSFRLPCFKWKNINLKLDLTKWLLPGLSSLLQNSPHVEALDLYIWSRMPNFFKRKRVNWIWQYDFDGESYWDSQVATFPCLETITIYVDVHEPNLIEMVKFLLKNSPRLEKMIIITSRETLEHDDSEDEEQDDTEEKDAIKLHDELSSEQVTELSHNLLALPRASSQAVIHFRER